MKRVLLMTIACCLFAVKGFGQEPAKEDTSNPPAKEDTSNAPEITFEETVHDFGMLPFKGVAECEFTFVNTGKEPLIIQNCPSTCGCTVPTCPKDKPIKPGEKGTIKVKYNNTNMPGTFSKQFTVISNAKNSPVRVIIKGEVAANTETAAK
ncbi:MAG: DUF1573 domain-containing protein [Bacteroidales bacterium]|jgi:hypothetical protein|nr:DUF1573 domain-containing protein [Bacteroidales bacterium]